MANFEFDQLKNPDENIKSFFDYLETIDKELAQLLRININEMPSADAPETERTQARRLINQKISNFLDQSSSESGL